MIEEGPILKPRQAADTPVSASRLRPRQHAWREMQREQLCGEGRVEVFREARLLSNRFRRRVAIRVAQTIGSSVLPLTDHDPLVPYGRLSPMHCTSANPAAAWHGSITGTPAASSTAAR